MIFKVFIILFLHFRVYYWFLVHLLTFTFVMLISTSSLPLCICPLYFFFADSSIFPSAYSLLFCVVLVNPHIVLICGSCHPPTFLSLLLVFMILKRSIILFADGLIHAVRLEIYGYKMWRYLF